MRGELHLPHEESDYQSKANDERPKYMCVVPRVLSAISQRSHQVEQVHLTASAPHCMPIMKNRTPAVLKKPPM